jgi:uncharacterized membrane protein
MKVIGIKVRDRNEGIFVLEALKTAIRNNRVALDDMALVTHDAHGKVKIEQTKGLTTKKGARRGMLVGALVGLAAPPLLGAAVVGGAAGAAWGKLRDSGIDDDLMKHVGELLADGSAAVFALGTDEAIAAVEAKVSQVTDGKMETFTVDAEGEDTLHEAAGVVETHVDEGLLVDSAVSFPEPETMVTPYSV